MHSKQAELESVHSEMRLTMEALGAGAELDAEHCASLMRRIEDLVAHIEASEAVDLKEALDLLIDSVTERMKAIELELKQVQQGKKGLKGYSHIRSYGTQQRLCRTA